MFLRKKYLLVDIKKDPLLAKAYSRQQTPHHHYVLTLNHKSKFVPRAKSATVDLEQSHLHKEFQLMKRIVVTVKQQKSNAS